MDSNGGNRFEDFFKAGQYLILKNYLYNYLLRKRAIEKSLRSESPTMLLEVGSGISPVVKNSSRRSIRIYPLKPSNFFNRLRSPGIM